MTGLGEKKRNRPKLFHLWEISTTLDCSLTILKGVIGSLTLKPFFKHHRLKSKVTITI